MEKKKYRRPWWHVLAGWILPPAFKIFHPYRVLGKENMPKEGKTLICSNHVTMGDPVYLGCMLRHRQMFYMAKQELFKKKFFAVLLKYIGAFPISRGTGGADGIQKAIDLIQSERVVCMFPEGTRSKTGELLNPKSGMAMLAYRTQCTVVPVAIVGEDGKPPRIFHKMVINVGKPIPFEKLEMEGDSPAQYRKATRIIFDQVRSLREEALDVLNHRWKQV